MRTQIIFTLFFVFIISPLIGSAQQSSQPTATPKTIAAGVVNSKALNLPKPEYPPAAQAVKASGEVKVQIVIDETGSVNSASAISGHPLLRQAAERAARQATFKPTTLLGKPVKVTGVIVYNFAAAAKDNEEKLALMGFAAFLAISRTIALDDEWESIVKDFPPFIPDIGADATQLKTINKNTDKATRTAIINKFIAAVESKLNGADAWQFEFGKIFGELMAELRQNMTESEGAGVNQNFDEASIKLKLSKISDFISTVPGDFPPDVLKKFKELIKFTDEQNLNANDTKSRLLQVIGELLTTIFPNSPE